MEMNSKKSNAKEIKRNYKETKVRLSKFYLNDNI